MTRSHAGDLNTWPEGMPAGLMMPMGTGPLLVDLELVELLGTARIVPRGPQGFAGKRWAGFLLSYAGRVLNSGEGSESELGILPFDVEVLELRQVVIERRGTGAIIDARWSPRAGYRVAAYGLETLGSKRAAQDFLDGLDFLRRLTVAERTARARAARSAKSRANRETARALRRQMPTAKIVQAMGLDQKTAGGRKEEYVRQDPERLVREWLRDEKRD